MKRYAQLNRKTQYSLIDSMSNCMPNSMSNSLFNTFINYAFHCYYIRL
nr:MAG TPA: hypothetical protein [Myoviridae sp. ctNqw6]